MNPLWEYLRDISAAADADRVANLVRKYVATILPSDLAALPVPCQALLQTNIGDILTAALIFAQSDVTFEGNAEAAMCLHQLSCALLVAAERIAQLS